MDDDKERKARLGLALLVWLCGGGIVLTLIAFMMPGC